jgi:hypothetical protein
VENHINTILQFMYQKPGKDRNNSIMTPPTYDSKQPGSWKDDVEATLRKHLKRVYYNGSTDVIARQNKVITNDTKLGEVQIEKELAEAIQAIIKANKKWLIGDDEVPINAGNYSYPEEESKDELREEQRKAMM